MKRKSNVQLVAERRYWREAEARLVVKAWRSSGETLSGFARRHSIERGRLSRWVSRLRRAGRGSVRFHPIRLVETTAESGAKGAIEIELTGGRRVRVPRGFETEELRRVLSVLEEAKEC